MDILWTILVLYIACCVISAGAAFAYILGEYPGCDERGEDLKFSWIVSIAGPMSLIVTWNQTNGFKHGWRLPL